MKAKKVSKTNSERINRRVESLKQREIAQSERMGNYSRRGNKEHAQPERERERERERLTG